MNIVLASGSKARREMLENVGLTFDIIPADIDESEIQNNSDIAPQHISEILAANKALHVSKIHPDTLVIGSDQVLECDDQIFSKANNHDEAAAKLRALRGKTHRLISAVTVAHKNHVIWKHTQTASLSMHDFDDDFLEGYLRSAGDALTSCVGAYALEEKGSWLFDKIQGDYFTILGMPLLPLLSYLNKEWGINP